MDIDRLVQVFCVNNGLKEFFIDWMKRPSETPEKISIDLVSNEMEDHHGQHELYSQACCVRKIESEATFDDVPEMFAKAPGLLSVQPPNFAYAPADSACFKLNHEYRPVSDSVKIQLPSKSLEIWKKFGNIVLDKISLDFLTKTVDAYRLLKEPPSSDWKRRLDELNSHFNFNSFDYLDHVVENSGVDFLYPMLPNFCDEHQELIRVNYLLTEYTPCAFSWSSPVGKDGYFLKGFAQKFLGNKEIEGAEVYPFEDRYLEYCFKHPTSFSFSKSTETFPANGLEEEFL